MKRLFLTAITTLLLVGNVHTARAATLFYGGDWYGNGSGNGTATSVHRSDLESVQFQNFIVPAGQSWQVSALFANHLIAPAPTLPIVSADWSIRSGVSVGNGGTLIASGANAPVTLAPTGRGWNAYLEETFTVDGLNVILPAGTYWMSVTPLIGTTDGLTYNTVTVGTNGIGVRLPDQVFGLVTIEGMGVTQNYVELTYSRSSGVIGAVPEPESLLLAASGAAAVMFFAGRYRRAAARPRGLEQHG